MRGNKGKESINKVYFFTMIWHYSSNNARYDQLKLILAILLW